MPLPGDLGTVVLTGTFLDPAGNPMRGTVTIAPNATLTDATGDVIIPQLQRHYQLFNGSFTTAPLVGTDNSDINPSGWTYVVTVALQEVPSYSFNIALPTSGSPVDLSTLSPAQSIPQLAGSLPVTGGTLTGKLTLNGSPPLQIQTGAAAGDVLTSDASGNATWQPISGAELPAATSSSQGAIELNTDLGGTATAPHVVATHLASALPLAQGGTGNTTGQPSGTAGGDLGSTYPSPQVTSTHLASPLPVAQGGTSGGTQQAAINALTGTQASGTYLRSNGTNASLSAIQAGDVPTLNQNTTGTAAGLSATLAVGSGGTGQTTQQTALDALAGAQTSGSYLRGNGTHVTMSAVQAGDLPAATSGAQGAIQLAGDLGGTAASPKALNLSGLQPSGDNTGATDLANINALLASAGTVYLGAGTFKINGSLTPVTGSVILGQGDAATVITQLSTTLDTITGTNLKSFVMRGVRLQGPASGSANGVYLKQTSANVTTYVDISDCRTRQFGGDGIKIDNPIVSRLSRVISDGNGGNGFNINGGVSSTVGTSVTLEACYGLSNTLAGYRLTSIHYSSLITCATDACGSGYIFTSCNSIAVAGTGAENATGNAYTISGGKNITLIDAYNATNNGIAFWVTGSAQNVRLIHPGESSPGAGATASIQVDSGCYVTVERPDVTTAVSYSGTVAGVAGVREAADVNDRFYVDSNGVMRWGNGTGSTDVFLQRISGPLFQTGTGTQVTAATSTNSALQAHVTGDTAQRYNVDLTGKILWGPGNASADTQISRTAAGVLTVQPVSGTGGMVVSAADSSGNVLQVTNTSSTPAASSLHVTGNAAADRAYGVQVTGDTNDRFKHDTNGLVQWGPGNATQDTNLYRNGAGILKTDGIFQAGGSLTVDGTALASPQPADLNLLAWSWDPASNPGTGVALGAGGTAGAGILNLIKIPLYGQSISTTGVRVYLTAAGSSLTSTENYLFLYNSSGTFIAATADQTSGWGGSAGAIDAAWASGPFPVSGAFCWVAAVYNGTTGPGLLRGSNLTAGMANGQLTAANSRYGSILSSITTNTPGNFTPSSISQKAATIWAALY